MFEYKVVPAPQRTVKVKGLKTTAERFAHLMSEVINAEAAEGWEYLRAESLPCEERRGFTGTAKSVQTVLVFRRALHDPADQATQPAADWREPAAPMLQSGGASVVPLARQEPQLRPGGFEAPAGRGEPVLRARPPVGSHGEDEERR